MLINEVKAIGVKVIMVSPQALLMYADAEYSKAMILIIRDQPYRNVRISLSYQELLKGKGLAFSGIQGVTKPR